MESSNIEKYTEKSLSLPTLPVLRVLMVAEGRIASTAIIDTIFSGLKDQGAIEYRLICNNETTLSDRRNAVRWCDVVFVFRASFPPTLSLLRFARDLGKTIIYSTDDDFLLLDKNSPLGKVYELPQNAKAYEAMFREADLVWVFTDEMVRRYRSLNSKIVLGNLPSPLELFSPCTATSDDIQICTIGYAGRFIHDKDLNVVVNPLISLLKESGPNLRLEFIDCIPEKLRGHSQVKFIPYFDDINNYYDYMLKANWSIGLALLEDTPFNRCKTNNKYREYAAFGIPGIYSDMPVYSSCVKHRVNGYLALHTEEGISEALRAMIADKSLRQSIRRNALQDISSSYSLKAAQLQMLREISLLSIEKMSKGVGKPRLLVIGYDKVSSTHIDALQPCRALESAELLSFILREPGSTSEEDVSHTDFVYIVRAFEKVNLPVMEWAHSKDKPMICSWDDNFFVFTQKSRLGEIYAKPETKLVMEKFLRECSLIVTPTPPLVSQSKTFNPNVMEAIYGLKAPDCTEEISQKSSLPFGKLRIGFFGSNEAMNEQFIIEALKKLRERYGQTIVIEIIGSKPSKELRRLVDSSFDIVWVYDEALRLLRSRHWDIGLAPLMDTDFNAAKQATKFRDYAWCGAAIIASDVPAYRRTMLDGIHCLLVKNTPSDWENAIISLIEKEDLRKFLVAGATNLLQSIHLQDKTIASWIQLVWRMKKFKYNTTTNVHLSGFHATAAASIMRKIVCPSSPPLFAQMLRKKLSYRLVTQDLSWSTVEVLVGTHQGRPGGLLNLRILTENGQPIRETHVNLSDVDDNEWVEFSFLPIHNSAFVPFVLEFELKNPGLDTTISLYEISPYFGIIQRLQRRFGFGPPSTSLAYRIRYEK